MSDDDEYGGGGGGYSDDDVYGGGHSDDSNDYSGGVGADEDLSDFEDEVHGYQEGTIADRIFHCVRQISLYHGSRMASKGMGYGGTAHISGFRDAHYSVDQGDEMAAIERHLKKAAGNSIAELREASDALVASWNSFSETKTTRGYKLHSPDRTLMLFWADDDTAEVRAAMLGHWKAAFTAAAEADDLEDTEVAWLCRADPEDQLTLTIDLASPLGAAITASLVSSVLQSDDCTFAQFVKCTERIPAADLEPFMTAALGKPANVSPVARGKRRSGGSRAAAYTGNGSFLARAVKHFRGTEPNVKSRHVDSGKLKELEAAASFVRVVGAAGVSSELFLKSMMAQLDSCNPSSCLLRQLYAAMAGFHPEDTLERARFELNSCAIPRLTVALTEPWSEVEPCKEEGTGKFSRPELMDALAIVTLELAARIDGADRVRATGPAKSAKLQQLVKDLREVISEEGLRCRTSSLQTADFIIKTVLLQFHTEACVKFIGRCDNEDCRDASTLGDDFKLVTVKKRAPHLGTLLIDNNINAGIRGWFVIAAAAIKAIAAKQQDPAAAAAAPAEPAAAASKPKPAAKRGKRGKRKLPAAIPAAAVNPEEVMQTEFVDAWRAALMASIADVKPDEATIALGVKRYYPDVILGFCRVLSKVPLHDNREWPALAELLTAARGGSQLLRALVMVPEAAQFAPTAGDRPVNYAREYKHAHGGFRSEYDDDGYSEFSDDDNFDSEGTADVGY